VGLESCDLGRGRAAHLQEVDVERAALLAQIVEALLVEGEDRAAVLAGEPGDDAVLPVPGVVDPDVAGDGRRVALAPLVLAALLVVVDEEAPVAAEAGVLGRRGQDHRRAAAVHGNAVELGLGARRELAVGRRVEARAAEDDGLVVGRERVGKLGGRMEGQAAGRAAGRGHDEDVEVAEPVAGEGDGPAVVAPNGIGVVGVVCRQRDSGAAGGRDAVDVPFVSEGDRLPVGRDGRIAQPGRGGLRRLGTDDGGQRGQHGDGEKDGRGEAGAVSAHDGDSFRDRTVTSVRNDTPGVENRSRERRAV
jgi:hypothetical protein